MDRVVQPPVPPDEFTHAPEAVVTGIALDWTRIAIQLAGSKELIALKVLEKVYLKPGHPYVLDILVRELRSVARSKITVWRKVKMLERLGLLELIGKSPLIVWPREGIERHNVQHLLNLCYANILGEGFAKPDV